MWACDCTSLGGWAPSSRILPGRLSSPQSQMALAPFPHSTRRASAEGLSLPPGEALMRRMHPTLALPRKVFWSQQLLHRFSRRRCWEGACPGQSGGARSWVLSCSPAARGSQLPILPTWRAGFIHRRAE